MVLVIISLVVAGIIGGRSLLQAAKISGIIAEANDYKTALNAFELHYNALAGDMRNGYEYFDSSLCGDNDNYNHSGCNGNGDYHFNVGEGIRAFYHLKAADILHKNIRSYTDGIYSHPSPGTAHSNALYHNNVPLAENRFNDNTGWLFAASGFYEPAENDWFGRNGNWLIYGAMTGSWWINEGGALTPKIASAIDKKADNGIAGSGNITAINGSDLVNVNNEITPTCTLNGMYYGNREWDGGVNATYNVSAATESCVLHFYLGD